MESVITELPTNQVFDLKTLEGQAKAAENRRLMTRGLDGMPEECTNQAVEELGDGEGTIIRVLPKGRAPYVFPDGPHPKGQPDGWYYHVVLERGGNVYDPRLLGRGNWEPYADWRARWWDGGHFVDPIHTQHF